MAARNAPPVQLNGQQAQRHAAIRRLAVSLAVPNGFGPSEAAAAVAVTAAAAAAAINRRLEPLPVALTMGDPPAMLGRRDRRGDETAGGTRFQRDHLMIPAGTVQDASHRQA